MIKTNFFCDICNKELNSEIVFRNNCCTFPERVDYFGNSHLIFYCDTCYPVIKEKYSEFLKLFKK